MIWFYQDKYVFSDSLKAGDVLSSLWRRTRSWRHINTTQHNLLLGFISSV